MRLERFALRKIAAICIQLNTSASKATSTHITRKACAKECDVVAAVCDGGITFIILFIGDNVFGGVYNCWDWFVDMTRDVLLVAVVNVFVGTSPPFDCISMMLFNVCRCCCRCCCCCFASVFCVLKTFQQNIRFKQIVRVQIDIKVEMNKLSIENHTSKCKSH